MTLYKLVIVCCLGTLFLRQYSLIPTNDRNTMIGNEFIGVQPQRFFECLFYRKIRPDRSLFLTLTSIFLFVSCSLKKRRIFLYYKNITVQRTTKGLSFVTLFSNIYQLIYLQALSSYSSVSKNVDIDQRTTR